MKTDVMFSSKKMDWGTPQDLFDELNEEFNFSLDACADIDNHKCEKYYTVNNDSLKQDWGGEIVFMNPPYGRDIGKWMKKAYESSFAGATVVCLIPSRTDTLWWHQYAMNGEIRFIKGRLKFNGAVNPAPFPSAIVIFKPEHPNDNTEQ